MNTVLIIGGGRFGIIAIKELIKKNSFIQILAVVEPFPSHKLIKLCNKIKIQIWCQDGIQIVQKVLAYSTPPNWIIPCIPKHLLIEWLLIELANFTLALMPLPSKKILDLNYIQTVGKQHQAWYLSLTNTICPISCSAPINYCFKNNQAKNEDLWLYLTKIKIVGFKIAILRSYQLAPGLGGLLSCEMLTLRNLLINNGGRWLIATACRCHAVIQALKLKTKLFPIPFFHP